MFPLPASIVSVLRPFACLLSAPTLPRLHVLLTGALLEQGPRTVTAALRAIGLSAQPRFERDHRALNRARWSSRQRARRLPGVLLEMLPGNVKLMPPRPGFPDIRKSHPSGHRGLSAALYLDFGQS
jgi:hypothetical protein